MTKQRQDLPEATPAREATRVVVEDGAGRRPFMRGIMVHSLMARGVEVEVALATADEFGWPSVRMVLLRGVDDRGFVFFTNYGSRKAHELEANPQAALCFYCFTASLTEPPSSSAAKA